jgi:hypothetical protein
VRHGQTEVIEQDASAGPMSAQDKASRRVDAVIFAEVEVASWCARTIAQNPVTSQPTAHIDMGFEGRLCCFWGSLDHFTRNSLDSSHSFDSIVFQDQPDEAARHA